MSEGISVPVPVLSQFERRVLGVLVEKQKTTDTYPLSVNAVVTGCNQKSNRDPIMNFNDALAEDTLIECQKKGLVMRVISGRVEKWRHLLYEAWKVSAVELSILAELMLRGPQTEGELRGRASRMDAINDLDDLRNMLKSLAERKFVHYLTPEGRRGTLVTHGFHDPRELEKLQTRFADGGGEPEMAPAPPVAASQDAPDMRAVVDELAALHREISALKDEVGRLGLIVQRIQGELGVS
jgi:hypothetical protein